MGDFCQKSTMDDLGLDEQTHLTRRALKVLLFRSGKRAKHFLALLKEKLATIPFGLIVC